MKKKVLIKNSYELYLFSHDSLIVKLSPLLHSIDSIEVGLSLLHLHLILAMRIDYARLIPNINFIKM